MKWGRKQDALEKDRLDGKPVPNEFKNPPPISLPIRSLWNAFWELSTDRQITQAGPGPIPSSSLRAYAGDHGLTGDHLERFRQIIRMLDGEYLKLTAPKSGPEQSDVKDMVPADDVDGVRGILSRFGARAKELGLK